MTPKKTIQIRPQEIELVQSRAVIDQTTVDEYAAAMREGAEFPAVDAVFDGESYWCWDGCHRVLAARQAKVQEEMVVQVSWGTHRDAMLLAAGANATHGLRRTNDDKRRAVTWLLEDPEWAEWSDREIARRCKVSQPFVSKMRESLTDNVISERTYRTKHGTVATMNTSNIGQSQPEPEPQETAPAGFYPDDDTPLTQLPDLDDIPETYLPFVTTTGEYHKWTGEQYVHLHPARTGFPKACPDSGATPNGRLCQDCDYECILDTGAHLCSHESYQDESGTHWCRKCGIELGPYAEAQGWHYCGGDTCLKDQQASQDIGEQMAAPAPEPEPESEYDGETGPMLELPDVHIKVGPNLVLVPADTDAEWFQKLLFSFPACFLNEWGRQQLAEPNTGDVLFYTGAYVDDFFTEWFDHGVTVEAM